METGEELTKIYERVIDKTPYNMATPFLLNYTRIRPKESFGYPCNWMSEKIAKEIENKNLCDIYYLRDNRHYLLIGECGGEEYIFEPYLLASKPIKIQKQTTIEAYPYSQKKGFIKITTNERAIKMQKGRYNPQEKKYHIYNFKFDRTKKEYAIPAMTSGVIRKWLYHPEQTSISIRPLWVKQKKVLHLIYPIAKYHGKEVKKENIYIKTNDSRKVTQNQDDYYKLLKEMAKKLKMKPEKVTNYLLKAAEKYEKHSPKRLKYLSKNPTNN